MRYKIFLRLIWQLFKGQIGGTEAVAVNSIFGGIGRNLNINGITLENAGFAVKEDKLVVDKNLSTSNKKLYLCGDVAGSFILRMPPKKKPGYCYITFLRRLKRS